MVRSHGASGVSALTDFIETVSKDSYKKSNVSVGFGFGSFVSTEIKVNGEYDQTKSEDFAKKKWADAQSLVNKKGNESMRKAFEREYSQGIYRGNGNGKYRLIHPLITEKSISNSIRFQNKVMKALEKNGIKPTFNIIILDGKGAFVGYKVPQA